MINDLSNENHQHARSQPRRPAPDCEDGLRRVMLGMLAELKRRFPDDWRRMVAEINEAKAA